MKTKAMESRYVIVKEEYDDMFGEVMYDIADEAFHNVEDAEEYLKLEGYVLSSGIEDDGFIEYRKMDGSHNYAIVRRVSVY